MGFLKSKNSPTNLQNDWINSTYKGSAAQSTADASSAYRTAIDALTGSDGGQGFKTYKQSLGYNNILGEAMRGVTGSRAARGLLNSGSTLMALQDRAGQIAQGAQGNWLSQLLQAAGGAGQFGLGQGSLVADVGSQRKRRGGLGSVLGTIGQVGQAVGGLASLSDPRAKENIEILGVRPDGLGVYAFNYIGDTETQIGVMAHEVAKLRPDALGPVVDGLLTVDYSKLEGTHG